jgi:hypothetical protein
MAGSENDVAMGSPSVPERLEYAPAPDGTPPVTPNGYILVGYDRLPPVSDWPGVVLYVLDRNASDLRPHGQYDGMEEGLAVYRLKES